MGFLPKIFSVALLLCLIACQNTANEKQDPGLTGPIVLSTWPNQKANDRAAAVLENNGNALDAIEAGIREKEIDSDDESVGLGGLPDAHGNVTLDACIMDFLGNAGSVTFLSDILHPISVARLVMDSTPHVMLSGKGAYDFALEHGFEPTELLTDNARRKWQEWQKTRGAADNHDTIGMLARDAEGRLSGGCSTSGMAYKLPGRVGDSPIIGAGLYVDNEVGAATATGVGEEVMKTVGSFLVVELMRTGLHPQKACEEAVRRIVTKRGSTDFQVGYIALDKEGRIGAYSVMGGFEYTLSNGGNTLVNKADSYSN